MAARSAFDGESTNKIKREVMAEKVVHRVLELVKSGLLKSGDKLPAERELIEIFGVSRPTLREALRALAILGVLDVRHGGGTYVTDLKAKSLLAPLDFYVNLSVESVSDSFECRKLLEIEIARKCAQRATDEDITGLEEMLEAQVSVDGDPTGFRILDAEFHEKLFAIGGNAIMERLAFAFYNMGLDVRRKAHANKSVTLRSVEDHYIIVRAIKSRNVAEAGAAMASHLDNIETTTIEALQNIEPGAIADFGG